MRKKLVFLLVLGMVTAIFWKTSINKVGGLPTDQSAVSGGIVPHYEAAKKTTEKFYATLSSYIHPKTIVIVSPDHFGISQLAESLYIGMGSESKSIQGVKIDQLTADKLVTDRFLRQTSAIEHDHGIGEQLLWIKQYLPDSRVVPILISAQAKETDIQELVESLDKILGTSAIVVASVDFSHYLPQNPGALHDAKSIATIENWETEKYRNMDVDSWQAILTAQSFAQKRGLKGIWEIGRGQIGETSYYSCIFGSGKMINPEKVTTLLIVGDMMFDRDIKFRMNKYGYGYPFEKVLQFFRGVDTIAGNLEGPITKTETEFTTDRLIFNFPPRIADNMAKSGINLVSVANNHTLNQGITGLEQTRVILTDNGISWVGDPAGCSNQYIKVLGEVVWAGFNLTTADNCPAEKLKKIISEVVKKHPDKYLAVMVHWGWEYQPKSSRWQQEIGHLLIDAGADAVFGQHPHVVQEAEIYNNKLIFYSLGNFIFDQYFSAETQIGLTVGVEIRPDKVIYRLIPVQLIKGRPQPMDQEQAEKWLEQYFEKSDGELSAGIKDGIVKVTR